MHVRVVVLKGKDSFALDSFSLLGLLKTGLGTGRVKRQKPWLTGFFLHFVGFFFLSDDFPSCLFICKTRLHFFIYECITFANSVTGNYHSYQ